MVSMILTIAGSGAVFIALKVYLHRTGYYYHSKYGSEKQKKNKIPRTGGNR